MLFQERSRDTGPVIFTNHLSLIVSLVCQLSIGVRRLNGEAVPKKVRFFSRISLPHLRPYFPLAKLLHRLGLRKNPPLDLTVKLCTSSEPDIRSAAFKYLIDSIPSRYPDYRRENFGHVAFIPAVNDFGPCMGTPNEVSRDVHVTNLN